MKKRMLALLLLAALLVSLLVPTYAAKEETPPVQVLVTVYGNLMGTDQLEGLYRDNVFYISPEDVCRLSGARLREQGYDSVTYVLHDAQRVITVTDKSRVTEISGKKKLIQDMPAITYQGELYVSAPDILRYMGATVGFAPDETATVHMMVSMPYTVQQLYADYMDENGFRFSWAECSGKLINPAKVRELAALDTIMLGYDSNVLAYALPGYANNIEKQVHTDALLELLRTEGTELVQQEDISVEILGYLEDNTEVSFEWIKQTMDWAANSDLDKKLAESWSGRMDAAGVLVDLTSGCISSLELAKQFANLSQTQKDLMKQTLCRVQKGSGIYNQHPVMFQSAKEAHGLMTGEYSAGEKAAWDSVYNVIGNAVDAIVPPNPFTTAFDVMTGIAKLSPMLDSVLKAEQNITFACDCDDVRVLAEQLLWTDVDKFEQNNYGLGVKDTTLQENMKYDMILSLKGSLTARLLLLDTGWLEEDSANWMEFQADRTAKLLNKAQNARAVSIGIYEINEEDISWIEKLARAGGFGNVVVIGSNTYYWRYNAASFYGSGYITFSMMSNVSNTLMCRDAEGKTKSVIRVCGNGEFAIANGYLVYSNENYEVCSVRLDGRDEKNWGKGDVYAVSSDGKYVICMGESRLFTLDPTSGKKQYLGDADQFVAYYGGKIYYAQFDDSEQGNLGAVTLCSISPDGKDGIKLYKTAGNLYEFNGGHSKAMIDHIRFTEDYIYFSYGCLAGTGIISQGSGIVRVGYDGTGGRVMAGRDGYVDGQFTVTEGNSLTTYEPRGIPLIGMGYDLETSGGSIYVYDRRSGFPQEVVSYGDYNVLGSAKVNDYEGDEIILPGFVEVVNGKVYYLLHAAKTNTAQVNWRDAYVRTRSAMMMKDLETGKVTVLYTFE